MREYDLPDAERIDELEGLINNLERARQHITPHADAVPEGEGERLERADVAIRTVIESARNELDDLPEWDDQLVQDLVLDRATLHDANIETVQEAIVIRFTAGDFDNERDLRFEMNIPGSGKWLHEDRDGEWVEVWSN